MNEKKGISQIHHDFNKQTSNRQTSSHADYFGMTFSDHSNGLAYNILWNGGGNKQEKRYSNHGCTKADTLRLKKYWEYMIKKNRSKSLE